VTVTPRFFFDVFKNRINSKEKISVISVSENSKNSEPLVVIVQYFSPKYIPELNENALKTLLSHTDCLQDRNPLCLLRFEAKTVAGTSPKRESPDWEGEGVPNFSEKKISRYGADVADREPLEVNVKISSF
jgi:hypothetical protein